MNEYKNYIKEAKIRIANKKPTQRIYINRGGVFSRMYYLCGEALTLEEIAEIYERVSELYMCGEKTLALKELINKTRFDELNEVEKQRYVLDLSKLYLDIRAEILNEVVTA